MVAILGVVIFLMGVSLLAAWATIESKSARIAELEALREPTEKRVPWHVEVVHAKPSALPEIWPADEYGANDKTKASAA